MAASGHFLYSSLSKSLKYNIWLLGAISITIPHQNHWYLTYNCSGQFPVQFLGAISITIPYQNHWNMTYGCYGSFPLKCLIKSMRYETWLLRTISFTTPYQHPCNMTYDCSGPLPIQFLIKCIEIWDLVARGNFLYNSLSKSLKSELCLPWAISCAILYRNHWNMTPGC